MGETTNTMLLKIAHPEIAKELHPTKNTTVKTETLTTGSGKSIWWLGKCGHEWEAAVALRVKGFGKCKQCTSLQALAPEIAKQWHPTKNGELITTVVQAGTPNKAWWLGDCGHEWNSSVRNRYRDKQNCPYCSNQKVLEGFNDLSTTDPEIAKYWNYELNSPIKPTQVTQGSKTKRWWLLECGHSMFKSSTHLKKLVKIECKECNSIATKKPELLTQWHPTKNVVEPREISKGSDTKAWWLGECGHEWNRSVYTANKANVCPICNNQEVLKGYNDLETTNYKISQEWHPTKNNLNQNEITKGASRKVWWLCNKNHDWKAIVSDRNRGSNCPNCSSAEQSSKAEKEIGDILENAGLTIERNSRTVIGNGKELDIYIPSLNLAIEFNGLYWHAEEKGKDSKYHYNKWKDCKDKGIQLIQIWEDDWKIKKEIITESLLHKTGISSRIKIHGRKCSIEEVSTMIAKEFTDKNHIQGFASGSKYLALKHVDEIVALLILKQRNISEIEIVRYCTSYTVMGGFSKLYSKITKMYPQATEVVTFADHCVSDGNLYELNGFKKLYELAPDYMYIVNGLRKHKFGYRLKKFKNDPNLKYEEGLTERELAQLNGISRIWDAGKTKYGKILTTTNKEQHEGK